MVGRRLWWGSNEVIGEGNKTAHDSEEDADRGCFSGTGVWILALSLDSLMQCWPSYLPSEAQGTQLTPQGATPSSESSWGGKEVRPSVLSRRASHPEEVFCPWEPIRSVETDRGPASIPVLGAEWWARPRRYICGVNLWGMQKISRGANG